MSVQVDRATQVRAGVRVEVFTVLWMIVEAAISIGAGVLASSALLTCTGYLAHPSRKSGVLAV